ncbi:MAG: MotE family protein [Alphaproteobacteria bacterium]|nr:MotE family protein [Alphaproteobacteria bacterium]
MSGVSQFKIIPVLVVVVLMAFSIRLVDFATGVSSLSGAAFAESVAKPHEEEKPSEEKPVAQNEAAAPEKTDEAHKAEENKPAAAAIDWRDASDEEPDFEKVKKEVFDDLVARQKELDKREQDLATREALFKAAEQELDLKYQELNQLRGQIETLLDKQSAEEQASVASLVKIYENMKPKEAARIFDTLDLDVLVSVVSKMSERRLSPILAAMNPERARTVTIMLSEEKQLPSLP